MNMKVKHVITTTLCSLLSVPILGSSNAHAFVFVTFGGGTCLEARFADTADGTPIQSFRCNATFNQQWKWERLFIKGATTLDGIGKCIDVLGGGTADGTPVQLFECNGTLGQQWIFDNGRIIGLVSGLCLDVGDGAPSTQATIRHCDGSSGQRWTIRS